MRIALIVTSILAMSFSIGYFSLLKRLKVVSKAFAQMVAVNASMREAFDASLEFPLTKEEEDIHKENFIKFLSDSRDWAFEYIEDVQKGLAKFVNKVEPEISYFDKYGIVGEMYPHYDSMKIISKEYKELKSLLPEDSDDRR